MTNVSTTSVVSFLAPSRDDLYRAGCRNVSRRQLITITECTLQDDHITTSVPRPQPLAMFARSRQPPLALFACLQFPALKLCAPQ